MKTKFFNTRTAVDTASASALLSIRLKLTLFAFALLFTGKSFAQCPGLGTFNVQNNLGCSVEVWIEQMDCTVPGSAVGWWTSIPAGSSYSFPVGANDDVDIILLNVGGTNLPAASLNSYNPCPPAQACLPGSQTGNSGPTNDSICPTYNMVSGGPNQCDINP